MIAAMLIHNVSMAQIVFDFEDHDISLWGIEGDGSIIVDTVNGNPGSALRVEEPATGARNFVIAHPGMTGDWSSASINDSIYWDLLVHRYAGTMPSTNNEIIELKGPGGYAEFPGIISVVADTFMHFSVSLNPADWTIISGTWAGLMQSVDFIRIRAEYVVGDEYVLLDNVGLTFSPVVNLPQGYICSNFDSLDGLDGWNFIQTGSLESDSTEGNPPNSIRIGDASGNLSFGYAPPKFRGNMSALNDTGTITFDVMDVTNLNTLSLPPHLVRLAGPGGEATFPVTAADAAAIKNVWHSFSIPFDDSLWTVTSGTWTTLLANVTVIEIALEYYNGTAETVYFDNFCIGNYGQGASTVPELSPYQPIHVYPNPGSGIFTVEVKTDFSAGDMVLKVFDLTGRKIFEEGGGADSKYKLDLRAYGKGIYFLSVSSATKSWQMKIIIH